jgi:hypothetical protein
MAHNRDDYAGFSLQPISRVARELALVPEVRSAELGCRMENRQLMRFR